MANNYCQWSESIEELTEEEMDWLHSCFSWEPPEGAFDDEKFEWPAWYDRDAESVHFEYDLDRKRGILHVYAEEYGNIDTLSALIHEFIQKFRPDFIFSMSWADTCSKMRIGEFGGGAMVISREGEKWINTDDFINNTVNAIKAGRGDVEE